MTGSARGTAEQCGRNVKRKNGLNRSLLRVAAAEMNASLLRVGERVGARVELVRAAGTSIRMQRLHVQEPQKLREPSGLPVPRVRAHRQRRRQRGAEHALPRGRRAGEDDGVAGSGPW